MQIIFNIFPRIRLHCKLVPLQYWEYEYGLFFINHVPLHVLPLPVYPGLQAQRYEPIVLEHCAFTWQVEGKEVHSLTSAGKRNNVSIKWSMRCLPDLPLSLGFEWKKQTKIFGIEMNDRFQCSIFCLYFLLCCRFVQYAAANSLLARDRRSLTKKK